MGTCSHANGSGSQRRCGGRCRRAAVEPTTDIAGPFLSKIEWFYLPDSAARTARPARLSLVASLIIMLDRTDLAPLSMS